MVRLRNRLGAAVSLALLSCQVVMGLEEPVGVAPASDAGPAEGGVSTCGARPVGPPTDPGDSAKKDGYWFALKSLQLPLPADATLRGFDLDSRCTTCEEGVEPSVTCTSKTRKCDLANGVDDALGEIAKGLGATGRDPAKLANDDIQLGARTLLVYLSDYNGTANDAEVGVQFVNSDGLFTKEGCPSDDEERALTVTTPLDQGRYPTGGARYAPAFDGCDRWSPTGGVIGTFPDRRPVTINADRGYVHDQQLVVQFTAASTELFGRAASIRLGTFTAKIEPALTGGFQLTGIITGRMTFDDLAAGLGSTQFAEDPDGGNEYVPICRSLLKDLVRTTLCDARDVMSATSDEGQGKPCDSISLALGFTALHTQIGENFAGTKYDPNCEPIRCD